MRFFLPLVVVAVLSAEATPMKGGAFQYLDLPENAAVVRSNSDGSLQLVNFRSTPRQIATWTTGGRLNVIDLGNDVTGAIATDLSKDGSVVVGKLSRMKSDGGVGFEYFAWRKDVGAINLGEMDELDFGYPVANNASPWVDDDGTRVLFKISSQTSQRLADIDWDGQSAHSIGEFPYAYLSDDGHVMVGAGNEDFQITYSVNSGPVDGLLMPSSHDFDLNGWTPQDVSRDGMVFGGVAQYSDGLMEGFIVGRDAQPQLLGLRDLGIAHSNPAFAMNADATVVIGSAPATSGGPAVSFYWTATDGVKDLSAIVAERTEGGLPPTQYTLRATDVSDNGLIVSGLITTGGDMMPFRAYLGVGQTLGDTDNDGDVDLADLNNVRNNFGGTGLGDTEGNGTVDLADLNNVRNHFGDIAPVNNPVPEPGTLGMAFLSVVAVVAFRRHSGRR